jgi:hypothetical protein
MSRLTIITTTEQAQEMSNRLERVAIATRADDYQAERAKPIQWLECTCCGEWYKGRQWWNQDEGFGLGDCCVKYNGVNPNGGESGSFGVLGIHFLIPPEPVDVNGVNELHLTADELRTMAESEIGNGFNVEYWREVLKAI